MIGMTAKELLEVVDAARKPLWDRIHQLQQKLDEAARDEDFHRKTRWNLLAVTRDLRHRLNNIPRATDKVFLERALRLLKLKRQGLGRLRMRLSKAANQCRMWHGDPATAIELERVERFLSALICLVAEVDPIGGGDDGRGTPATLRHLDEKDEDEAGPR